MNKLKRILIELYLYNVQFYIVKILLLYSSRARATKDPQINN